MYALDTRHFLPLWPYSHDKKYIPRLIKFRNVCSRNEHFPFPRFLHKCIASPWWHHSRYQLSIHNLISLMYWHYIDQVWWQSDESTRRTIYWAHHVTLSKIHLKSKIADFLSGGVYDCNFEKSYLVWWDQYMYQVW